MTELHKLIEEIDAFLRFTGVAETTFGRKAVNDGKLLRRLRSGGSVTVDKAAQIRGFMASSAPQAAKNAVEPDTSVVSA